MTTMTPIHALKARTGLGFIRLARLLGAHPSTVRNWLRGRVPSTTRATQIESYLIRDPADLATLASQTTKTRKDRTP